MMSHTLEAFLIEKSLRDWAKIIETGFLHDFRFSSAIGQFQNCYIDPLTLNWTTVCKLRVLIDIICFCITQLVFLISLEEGNRYPKMVILSKNNPWYCGRAPPVLVTEESLVCWKWKWNRLAVSGSLRPPWTVAYQAPLSMEFSRWSSQPRDQTRVSLTAGRALRSEPPGKP